MIEKKYVSKSHQSHDDDNLGAERIHLLTYVRTARVRIDQLRLNMLNNDRESPSHSSFGRTNKRHLHVMLELDRIRLIEQKQRNEKIKINKNK
ncbi:unnamed protein product [Rotaria socialis]|uniref:Uncharacterized protein n=2 Tax=Rotaria socialis TaxID=392032 RepID=A0A822ANE3_9BILA|nr:unnamed protein product [Rotaria socialis]